MLFRHLQNLQGKRELFVRGKLALKTSKKDLSKKPEVLIAIHFYSQYLKETLWPSNAPSKTFVTTTPLSINV